MAAAAAAVTTAALIAQRAGAAALSSKHEIRHAALPLLLPCEMQQQQQLGLRAETATLSSSKCASSATMIGAQQLTQHGLITGGGYGSAAASSCV
jgi:hypothetical protein